MFTLSKFTNLPSYAASGPDQIARMAARFSRKRFTRSSSFMPRE